MENQSGRQKLRNDIQVLRAIAVLSVLLYHAKLPWAAGGYLGVDVFFVISGFLMTRMISESMASGQFTLRGFYFRRAKRLLPAAYLTLFATAALAPFVLGDSAIDDFKAQLAGSVGFMANVVLWRQTGYFQNESEMQPLLHMWSLSLEEQYYFILPALLLLTPRRFWKPVAVGLIVASATACFFLVTRKPVATFYLLPTRAWELGIGSMGALLAMGPYARRLVALVFWPSLLGLFVVFVAPQGRYHPGLDAALACLATLVVILRRHPIFDAPTSGLGVLVGTGNISYSLYLVHWPLLAFLNNVWVGADDGAAILVLRTGLLALSVMLALLLSRHVEEPLRHFDPSAKSRFFMIVAVSSICLLALSFSLGHSKRSGVDYAYERRPIHGIGKECNGGGDGAVFNVAESCATTPHPQVMVWGDSYATALVPGLAESFGDEGVIQATRDACGPLQGVAVFVPAAGRTLEWDKDCIGFNDSVLDFLGRNPGIRTVVLSSAIQYYFDNANAVMRPGDVEPRIVHPSEAMLMSGLARTIGTLRTMGKKVVIVAPPPVSGVNIGLCQERLDSGMIFLGARDCSIPLQAYHDRSAKTLALLDAVAKAARVEVISFDEFLCNARTCATKLQDVPLYRDQGHLSYQGSTTLVGEFDLVRRIREKAM